MDNSSHYRCPSNGILWLIEPYDTPGVIEHTKPSIHCSDSELISNSYQLCYLS